MRERAARCAKPTQPYWSVIPFSGAITSIAAGPCRTTSMNDPQGTISTIWVSTASIRSLWPGWSGTMARPSVTRRVIVNCNLLWISSPRHDLSTEKEAVFNHPALVPQFRPWIPCYKASVSERLGIVASRYAPIFGWADHVRITYFDSDDLATWTLDHPDENPLRQVSFELPSPNQPPSPEPDPRPWTDKGLHRLTPDWVPLDESLQWQFFRQTIQLLQQRGNQVFVLIGPLNEHMLTETGRTEYTRLKGASGRVARAAGYPPLCSGSAAQSAVRGFESSNGRRLCAASSGDAGTGGLAVVPQAAEPVLAPIRV